MRVDLRADDLRALERFVLDFLADDFFAPERRVDFLALLFLVAIVISPKLEWDARRSPGGSWSERLRPGRALDCTSSAPSGRLPSQSCMRRTKSSNVTHERNARAGRTFAASARHPVLKWACGVRGDRGARTGMAGGLACAQTRALYCEEHHA